MKRIHTWRFALALSFLFGVPATSGACDICGAFLGITPFDNSGMISLTHRYRVFNGYAAANQDAALFPAGAYRLGPAYSPLHGSAHSTPAMEHSDFESYKIIELKGRYFIHPRLELNFILPFADNKAKSSGETSRATGLGDLSVFGGWHAVQPSAGSRIRTRLVTGLGVKLPTGKTNAARDGERLDLMLQPGTGSLDGFVYVMYSGAGGKWRWGITSLGKYSGTNSYHEQVCPSTVSAGFVARQFGDGDWKLLPQVQFYQEFMKGFRKAETLAEGTGMNMILGGPGIEVYYKRFGFNMSGQFPIWQKADEMNMQAAGRLVAGISWSFTQQKYLWN